MVSLSLITAHYNNLNDLTKTYESLLSQSYEKWKMIIIDGHTKNFFTDIDDRIIKDSRIKIFQQESDLYDAMNIGILNVDTEYFQILNSGTIYSNADALSNAMQSVLKFDLENLVRIHSFQVEVVGTNLYGYGEYKKQIPSKKLFPFNSGHEAIIYPNRFRNRILHSYKRKISADWFFMFDYSKEYELVTYNYPLIKYPRGGASDNKSFFWDKINGLFSLTFITLISGRLFASLFAVNLILRSILFINLIFLKSLAKKIFYKILKP